MQSTSLSEQQSTELCDRIGRTLVEQLESEPIQSKIDQVIRDFVSQNNISANPDDLNNNIQVSVKVQMTK